MSQNKELLELVKSLSAQVEDLQHEIRGLKLRDTTNVPEDVLLAIAAGVAAYLGYAGEKRQRRFAPITYWAKGAHTSQLDHTPQLSR